MTRIIPSVRPFDQSTLQQMRDADPVVQRYRARFALLDWSRMDVPRPRGPGRPAHPASAYLKAGLVRISEHLQTTPRWRAYLLDHPLLVLELGFRPHIDCTQPYGFQVEKTVPSVRHLNNWLKTLDPLVLSGLFEQSVQALQQEIPNLGEVVAYDVKHIYANVKENNFRAYVEERFKKDQQPKNDPDCRLGVKTSTNQVQADGTTKEKKNTSGATAPAWPLPPIRSMAMSCWPTTRCLSMKTTWPTSCRSTSRPWPCSRPFLLTSRPTPPMTPGTCIRPVRLAVASLLFP